MGCGGVADSFEEGGDGFAGVGGVHGAEARCVIGEGIGRGDEPCEEDAGAENGGGQFGEECRLSAEGVERTFAGEQGHRGQPMPLLAGAAMGEKGEVRSEK